MAHELVAGYQKPQGEPKCAFKIDIRKAYDTVDWQFLLVMLKGMGFHPVMLNWIKSLITSPTFSICVNGQPEGFFMGDAASVEVIKRALQLFEDRLGLSPSLEKSEVFFRNMGLDVQNIIRNCLPFRPGVFPIRYLGVPLSPVQLKYRQLLSMKLNSCSVIFYGIKRRVKWENVEYLGIESVYLYDMVVLSHYIRGRNFWIIKKRNEWSWILRNLLELRPHCRRLFIYNVGNGLSMHAWEDTWSEFGPLIQLLSYKFINAHGFHNNSTVNDLMQRLGTNWPVEWLQQFPQLQSIMIPPPSQSEDTVRWVDAKYSRKEFE
ncbi:uncharacterized protein LOC112504650, partial [Cynara cardunculus var. scolymus]|uniref:uncharacterized protein LOC112504650 n=1 Tax=Cynara cardunculus var. scolymus TaxID=59895 RepID=UPI000D62E766